MDNEIIGAIKARLDNAKSVVIASHVRPDGDAGERRAGGELIAQRGPDAPDAAHRHARFEQALGAAQQQQVAPPEEVYAEPANLHVARFMGYRNVFSVMGGFKGLVAAKWPMKS